MTQDVIRARRFELVDGKDRPWATLGFNGEREVQFNMVSRSGSEEILLVFHEDEPEIWLIAEGETQARLAVTHGEVGLELEDSDTGTRLKLHVDRDGAPHILTRTGDEDWTDVLTVGRAQP